MWFLDWLLDAIPEEAFKYVWYVWKEKWIMRQTLAFAIFEYILYICMEPTLTMIICRLYAIFWHICFTMLWYKLWRNFVTRFTISVILHASYNYAAWTLWILVLTIPFVITWVLLFLSHYIDAWKTTTTKPWFVS